MVRYENSIFKKLEMPVLLLTVINIAVILYQLFNAPIYIAIGEYSFNTLLFNTTLLIITAAWTFISIIAEWRMKRR